MEAMILTVPLDCRPGSAVDPQCTEISWQAWELTAADPARRSPELVRRVNGAFDCLVEAAWRPGRAVIVSEVEWVPEDPASGQPRLAVRLAVGMLGSEGSSVAECAGIAPAVESAFETGQVFDYTAIDPAVVVAACDPSREPRVQGCAAHIVQGSWTITDGEDLISVVSRFNPLVEQWTPVVDQLVRTDEHVRVRATVLASELSPSDRIEIESALARTRALRERNPERAEVQFDANRAEATLLDLRASFGSPLFIGEVLVWSPRRLPETTLRSLGACFTSETDVLRQQGHVVVAANRLLLGGFDVERDPDGWADAFRMGLPLRGGLQPHRLRDLITLTESPIGVPLPWGDGLPSLPTHIPVRRAVPQALQGSGAGHAVRIGSTPAGDPVSLPLDLRTRHLLATGTWGSGKSTLALTLALDDVRCGRPFLFIDPHGTAADELIAHARLAGRDPVVIDAADAHTDRIQPIPSPDAPSVEVDAAIRRLADAIASSLPNPEWAGPRWFAAFEALLELVTVHGGELIDAAVWFNDQAELAKRLGHKALSPLARSTLRNLLDAVGPGADVRGWVSSKLHPLVGASSRRILAPVGQGLNLADEIHRGRPVIVNLSALSLAEGNLVGHLALASVIDAAFTRSPDQRKLTSCYVDEAHRFPAAGLSRVLAEGRKFGIALFLAVQSLNQFPGDLADLAISAGMHAAFRATPDTAMRLAPVLGVTPQELLSQPDLHAVVAVQGQAACSVKVPLVEPCSAPRAVVRPSSSTADLARSRDDGDDRRDRGDADEDPGTEHDDNGVGADDAPQGTFVDEFIRRHLADPRSPS